MDDGLLAYLDARIADAIEEKCRWETRLWRLRQARASMQIEKPEQVAEAILDEYSNWKHRQPKEQRG